MPQVSLSAPNAARLAIAALSLLTGCGSGQGTYSQEPTTVPQVVEFAAPEASQGGSPGPAPSGAPFVTAFAEAEPAGDEVWENAEAMMACCNRVAQNAKSAPITQQPKMLATAASCRAAVQSGNLSGAASVLHGAGITCP